MVALDTQNCRLWNGRFHCFDFRHPYHGVRRLWVWFLTVLWKRFRLIRWRRQCRVISWDFSDGFSGVMLPVFVDIWSCRPNLMCVDVWLSPTLQNITLYHVYYVSLYVFHRGWCNICRIRTFSRWAPTPTLPQFVNQAEIVSKNKLLAAHSVLLILTKLTVICDVLDDTCE